MVYSLYLKTKADLKAYILRKLGSEAVNIEISDDNLEDAISDTLEIYMRYAYDGMIEKYIPLSLIKNKQSYTLDLDVFAVLGVHVSGVDGGIVGGIPTNMFSINQYVASDLYRGGKIDLLTYSMVNSMLSSIDLIFGKKVTYDYNGITRELNLFQPPTIDEVALVHVYKRNIPTYNQAGEESSNMYNEIWVRQYATEKARYQWAVNIMKYEGSVLPGGIMLAVQTILTEAKENIEKLTLQLEEEYKIPCGFIVG